MATLPVSSLLPPPLDPGFVPASLWHRAFRDRVATDRAARILTIEVERPDGDIARHDSRIFSPGHPAAGLNAFYAERLVKFLLWQRGGSRVRLSGAPELAAHLARVYHPSGPRAFDADFMGNQVYREPFIVTADAPRSLPAERSPPRRLGGHLDGCRVGIDLGGSERKCVAVRDGARVHAESVKWDPYFQSDPGYHLEAIDDSIRRAAAHLPKVDAIGVSAAGIYVDNEVRVASLFRGVAPADFESRIRRLFFTLQERWAGVPVSVMNDGDVAALAGALSERTWPMLGLSLGTSLAGGYVTAAGSVTPWLNEHAFTPIDFSPDGAVDEWSGDIGCGAQYLSQQGAARVAERAGFRFAAGMGDPEKLAQVREAASQGEERAAHVYDTVGSWLGYAVAHYAEFYDLRDVLLLGGVTAGAGGERLLQFANRVLTREFPEIASHVRLRMPADDASKRHRQAIAAASLPRLP